MKPCLSAYQLHLSPSLERSLTLGMGVFSDGISDGIGKVNGGNITVDISKNFIRAEGIQA